MNVFRNVKFGRALYTKEPWYLVCTGKLWQFTRNIDVTVIRPSHYWALIYLLGPESGNPSAP